MDLIPNQFLVLHKDENSEEKIYEKMLLVVDYIAGMTDNFALQLYRKLKGIEVPHLQNLNFR